MPWRGRTDGVAVLWQPTQPCSGLGAALDVRVLAALDRRCHPVVMTEEDRVVVLTRHDQLDLATYWQIAAHHARVEVAPALLRQVAARRAAMERHLAAGATAYGVTTGLGYFADRTVSESDQPDLQRAILVGRAVGVGPPYEEPIVRGTMLLRLCAFLSGHAGVSAKLCTFLADRLNTDWYPVVPASRPGTAGETIPLCHLFQTLIGEGVVLTPEGRQQPAAAALADAGVRPYALQLKEGLALINGAPLAPALAADALRRATTLIDHATRLGAAVAWIIGSSWRPYSPRIGRLKGDAGQQRVHDQLGDAVAGAEPRDDSSQAPVSLRVLPQVNGAALDVADQLRRQIERELIAVTDSPLYLEADGAEPEGLYPSGNFHAQAISFWLDALAIAMCQVGALSEKRLHRLLDTRFSGLPDQLAADADRGGSGLVSLHKAVLGLCAENRLLAAPASIHGGDSSAGQEDAQALTGLAHEKLGRLLDNVELILASELIAVRQAVELGAVVLPPALRPLDDVATVVPFVDRDRSLAPDVEVARAWLRERLADLG